MSDGVKDFKWKQPPSDAPVPPEWLESLDGIVDFTLTLGPPLPPPLPAGIVDALSRVPPADAN